RQRDRERAAAEWLAMPLGMRTQLPQPLLDQERAVVDLVDRSPDRPRGAWRVVAATTAPATVSTLPPLALVQAGRFPGALDLTSRRMRDVAGSAGLAWDVLLPADAPHGMAMTVHLRDEDGRWFQVQPAQHPLPGTWTRFAVPWGDAAGWAGIGHRRPWTREILHRVGELGITLHGSATCAGEVAIANLRLITATPAAGTARLLAPAATVAAVGERWELRFDLAATHANPFDPDTIQVDAVITAPDGQERSFPAFWYQPYERRLEGGRERLDLVGGGEWRVRWRPQQPGLHRWRIRSQDAGGARTDLAGELTALPGDRPGYIRIAATDPTLLERRPGGWFYPIGQNLCQELDLQQPIPDEMPGQDRNGTYTYDRFLDRMGAARMTWFRLWLTPWSFGLEGRRGWPGFHGHGRYSQENAWRLDHVLDRAEALGMAVNLTLTHKSEYALDNCWADAPLNAGQGGPLADRRDFFTDPGVRTSYRKRLRYLVARWGDSPAVMAWELFGEANLVPGYEPSEAADWHRDLARTLQSLDHDRHPVFTHCHNWQVGTSLWELPEIGCVQGNGYIRPPNRTTDHVVNFARYLDEVARFRKPVFVAEYGGRSELGAPSADYLHAQLHSGLWASWTGPFAGAAFPWWWNVTDGLGWYRSFTALVVANAGADRLAHPHRQVRPAVAGDDLAAVGMQAADRGAYWIYGREVFTTVSGRRPRPETTLALTGLRPGAVVLRWFDTMTGTVLDQDGAVIGRDGRLRCRVPPFRGDVALRLDPAPP
ncbi:MAG: hypothetical protein RLZZ127_209, partial [Planctomycetota bacterium]